MNLRKQNFLNTFRNHMKTMAKSCRKDITAPDGNKDAEERSSPSQKVKRLKTRKERNQIRGQKVSSFYRSHKHSRRGSEEKASCCDRHSFKHSGKEKIVAKLFPAQKPSIITEGRLTSIRGLFSHEVRSVDIERLVKEQGRDDQAENTSLSSSTFLPLPSPLIPTVTSDERDTQEGQKSKRPRNEVTSKQTDHSEGPHPSTFQTCPETVDIFRSGSPRRTAEPVVLSSSESELFQLFSTSKANHKDLSVTPEVEDICTNVHQRLDNTPARSVHLNLDASQHDSAPDNCSTRSPVRDKDRSASADEGHHGVLMESEAFSHLAARLCQTLDLPPSRRRCPLLTECREVLLQTLQERNGHRVHSLCGEEFPNLSNITDQACSSSGQGRRGNTSRLPSIHFSSTRKYEDDEQSRNLQNQAGEDFRHNADGRWRRQTWSSNSPQDFFTELQSPCRDLSGQWSRRKPPQESLRVQQPSASPAISLRQAFTTTEVPTSYLHDCGTLISDPFFLQPQKEAWDSSKNRLREITELLDQWSSDPDVGFMFHKNATVTESRDWSPYQRKEIMRKGPPPGSSSTVSAFFPPGGFRYKPYYRFPHPFHSISKSEQSGVALYHHSDTKDLDLSPSLLMTAPYFRYLQSD